MTIVIDGYLAHLPKKKEKGVAFNYKQVFTIDGNRRLVLGNIDFTKDYVGNKIRFKVEVL